MNYSERVPVHAKMAREAVPDGTSCPEAPTRPCDLVNIGYDTNSASPRMYGRCDRCGTHYAFLLPRRTAYKNPTIECALRREYEDTVFVDACESVFTENGIAQRLAYLLSGDQFMLRRDVITEIEKHVERDVHRSIAARERQLTELLKLVWDRVNELGLELARTSYRSTRGAAAKAQSALNALKADVKREKAALNALREQATDFLVEVNRQRAEAVANGEPRPVDGAVLCSSVAPSEVIYGLIDPIDPAHIRYVGRTCDPVSRYRTHCTAGSDAVVTWARSVAGAGRNPVMVLIERCEREEVETREAHWIHYYRDRLQADLNRSIPRRPE